MEELRCLPVESHGRTSARKSRHFCILPCDAVAPAGANRLHGRFFGGEASGVALRLVRFGLAVANLAGGKDALQKPPPKALYGGSDARDLHNINAGSDDHGWRSERSQVLELRCSEEGNTLRIRVLLLLGAKPLRRNCLGFWLPAVIMKLLD